MNCGKTCGKVVCKYMEKIGKARGYSHADNEEKQR